jgi:predicted nucleotidyltransferase component of viral defense system
VWSDQEAIEIFHLLFLRAFGARVEKNRYVVKGGCNLRFFYRSVRFSEDLDVDVYGIPVATLRKNVDQVLAAQPFRDTVRAQRLEGVRVTAPKQTQTTQRWKVGLSLSPTGTELPTKIEFSQRETDGAARVAHEPVSDVLLRRYRLYPVIVQHYTAEAAIEQKIAALALRSQTQARDVFDLNLLLDAHVAAREELGAVAELLPRALENAMSVGFSDFVGQVVAFLEPEYQQDYGRRASWDRLQARIVEALEAWQA